MRLRNQNGFSMAEMLMAVAIGSFMMAGLFSIFMTGQSTWFTAEASMDTRDNIRVSSEKIARELQESGFDSVGTYQVTIGDGTGDGGTDLLRFTMPVTCHSGDSILNSTGDVAHWGAPLTWGCTDASCMDGDNNCETAEYKYIEYLLNDHNTLIRRALDYNQSVVREDVIASDITAFQAEANFNQRIIKISLTAETNPTGRLKTTASSEMNIYLRNAR